MVGFVEPDVKPDWWIASIMEAAAARPAPIEAHTFRYRWFTSSDPVLLVCDDGDEYVVKAAQAGRMIVTDQVVGYLGRAMGAPVGDVCTVDVPAELIKAEPQMGHMPPGVAHGCRLIADATNQPGVAYASEPQNRPRFALLSILYGWMEAFDHQLLYEDEPPHLVHSVDHGHFFPDGPQWTRMSLLKGKFAEPDAILTGACSLKTPDFRGACVHLRGIDDAVIARAVAQPPDSWGIQMPERVALAQYLARRRAQLLAAFLEDGGG